MNKDTHYREAFSLLWKGTKLLVQSIRTTIMTHKAITALVVSMGVNASLFFSLIEARTERDKMNNYAIKMELQNDSLSGKIIRYDFNKKTQGKFHRNEKQGVEAQED